MAMRAVGIDCIFLMGLIDRLPPQTPYKLTMSGEQLIGQIKSDAKSIGEREDIAGFVPGLPVNEALADERHIRSGFDRSKAGKNARELTDIASRRRLVPDAKQGVFDEILRHPMLDEERLPNFLEPLGLNRKSRRVKELGLMEELTPLLHKLAQGGEIAGLAGYEEGR